MKGGTTNQKRNLVNLWNLLRYFTYPDCHAQSLSQGWLPDASASNLLVLNEYLQNGLMVSNNPGVFHFNSLKHAT
jgi:hypothetical protein